MVIRSSKRGGVFGIVWGKVYIILGMPLVALQGSPPLGKQKCAPRGLQEVRAHTKMTQEIKCYENRVSAMTMEECLTSFLFILIVVLQEYI